MRYLLILPLVVMFLTGCSKSDRENINGKWSIYEIIGSDGKKMFSADKVEQKKLTDERVQEQLAMYAYAGIDEKYIRKIIEKQIKIIGNTTFTFNDKGIVKVETTGKDKSPAVESKFTMNEKTREITIKEKESGSKSKMKYKYTIDDEKITFIGTGEKLTLIRDHSFPY